MSIIIAWTLGLSSPAQNLATPESSDASAIPAAAESLARPTDPTQASNPMQEPAPMQPSMLAPKDTSWRQDHLRVLPPTTQGKGLWIAGIAAVSAIFVKQAILIYSCGDPGCRSGRLSDRLLWLGAAATLGYASSQRAHHVAYRDAIAQRLAPPSRRRVIWGGILLGVGALAFATDVGLQSACMLGKGPYFIDNKTGDPNTNYFYGCKGWAGTAMMDLGGAAIATGAVLLAWERSYRRDREIYRRGRLRVVPTLGGLRAFGRF